LFVFVLLPLGKGLFLCPPVPPPPPPRKSFKTLFMSSEYCFYRQLARAALWHPCFRPIPDKETRHSGRVLSHFRYWLTKYGTNYTSCVGSLWFSLTITHCPKATQFHYRCKEIFVVARMYKCGAGEGWRKSVGLIL
jgi:hypothetical protein